MNSVCILLQCSRKAKHKTPFHLLSLVLISLARVLPVQAGDGPLRQLPALVGGRVELQYLPSGEMTYQYAWPSIYFATAFVGRELTLEFDDPWSSYRIIVDGAVQANLVKPARYSYVVTALKPGKHRVRVEKLSETQAQNGRFLGFYAPHSVRAIALNARKRQVEFIGDSHTVGYGNTAPNPQCTAEELFKYTDTQQAFGPLVAKYFAADYQVNAYSGQGVVRNYQGIEPETNLLKRYPFTLLSAGDVYTNKNWRPRLIVIGLGTNDFSTPLTPEERWPNRQALQQDYVAQYVHFVQQLNKRSPRAHFILLASDQQEGEFAQQVKQVAARLQELGITQLTFIEYKNFEFTGCHWHPSLRDHKRLADQIIAYARRAKLWRD